MFVGLDVSLVRNMPQYWRWLGNVSFRNKVKPMDASMKNVPLAIWSTTSSNRVVVEFVLIRGHNSEHTPTVTILAAGTTSKSFLFSSQHAGPTIQRATQDLTSGPLSCEATKLSTQPATDCF